MYTVHIVSNTSLMHQKFYRARKVCVTFRNKLSPFRFSRGFKTFHIPHETPTIICFHIKVPSTLVSLFHDYNGETSHLAPHSALQNFLKTL